MSSSVDPTAEFEPGMFAQLKLMGNDIVIGVSDGTAPLGIIDDVRTAAFTKSQIDEIVVISAGATEISDNGDVVTSNDVKGELEFPSVIENSFVSTTSIVLNSVNGVITVPAGTELNHDGDGDGINDSFKVVVSYIYRIANKPGDDTTIGSGRVTVHYQRGIYATDQFDTTQIFPLNATLYVGLDGKLTSKQPTDTHPGVAFVTGPPSATNGTIEFLLL
jgi:hypothetical protein